MPWEGDQVYTYTKREGKPPEDGGLPVLVNGKANTAVGCGPRFGLSSSKTSGVVNEFMHMTNKNDDIQNLHYCFVGSSTYQSHIPVHHEGK